MTNNTETLHYRILSCILDYNVNLDFPKLKDILSKINFTSVNSVQVAICYLKNKGFIKSKGTIPNIFYYITELGSNRIREIEAIEERNRILSHYDRMFLTGD